MRGHKVMRKDISVQLVRKELSGEDTLEHRHKEVKEGTMW